MTVKQLPQDAHELPRFVQAEHQPASVGFGPHAAVFAQAFGPVIEGLAQIAAADRQHQLYAAQVKAVIDGEEADKCARFAFLNVIGWPGIVHEELFAPLGELELAAVYLQSGATGECVDPCLGFVFLDLDAPDHLAEKPWRREDAFVIGSDGTVARGSAEDAPRLADALPLLGEYLTAVAGALGFKQS